MAGWFTNSNVDAAELATVYRAPDQGVNAKSNSNIAINDYRKMVPLLNQGTGNSSVLVPSGSTIQYQDLQETGGIKGASNSYTTGSAKGSSSFTVLGAFTAGAAAVVRTDGSSTGQGSFRLGSNDLTMPSLNGIANFGSGDYLAGIGQVNSSLGGALKFVVYNGSGAGNIASTDWNTIHIRLLYPNGTYTTTITGTSLTFYNPTTTFNRTDTSSGAGAYTWTTTTSGNYRIWSAGWGLGALGPYQNNNGFVSNGLSNAEPYMIEIT